MREMGKLNVLVKRNVKIYFKDKMLFFVSLITPLILVVLFLTFLGDVYKQNLLQFASEEVPIPERIVNAFTGGWLFSSILSTCGITVAFCSNMMVNDKISHAVNDFNLTPTRRATVGVSYFVANVCTTLIVSMVVLIVAFLYLAIVGWCLSFLDVVLLVVVVLLNTLFGTLLASVILMFVNTQGAQSGVCTLVSSMYGFICGAYMPLSQFSAGIRAVVSCLPGTYTTVLLRHYFMRGTLQQLGEYLPQDVVSEIAKTFDGEITAFGTLMPVWSLFVIVVGALVLLGAFYVGLNLPRRHLRRKLGGA